MDPVSAILLFVLFQATEKVIGYAGGKVADSLTKPFWDALEEKAKWLTGKDETSKRWEAFSKAFTEARVKLENEGRHPEIAKKNSNMLGNFTIVDSSEKEWLNDLSAQLEKASLVSEKPDEFLLVELFSRVFSKQNISFSRPELSETVSDFVTIFQDRLFAQPVYREEMFKRAQWEALRQPHYDTRERYISQIIDYHENLDFVGIPELKDRQALRIEDVFISLQTQAESPDRERMDKAIRERDARALVEAQRTKITRQLSVNQALVESSKIVILGDPGSGKTTLLKYIVLAFAENKTDKLGLAETRLPIFIRLYDYVAKRAECGKAGFSFTDYLNKYCTDHLQLHLSPDFFEQALENGKCCICFDGLDELGAAGLRREITLAVMAMANRYARNRFIVTSRIVGYEEAPLDKREFAHHTVQPLSDEDIKLFVEKWYRAREKDAVIRRERTEHLIRTIMAEERIKSLASNPLMLTIIALVHRIEAELPHERVKLYDKCVATLVETWDKVRGMKTTLRRRLLEKLAYWMHSQLGEKGRTREVREGNLRLQLLQFLQSDPKLQLDDDQIQKEVEHFINLVKSRSGLLIERGEGVYTFSHLTFQEYLASCDIVARFGHSTDAIWSVIQPKLHDAHWREVILLLLGSLNRFEHHNPILVRRIYESSDHYEVILHRHLLLAARILADRVEVDVKLYNQVVDDLLNCLRSDVLASRDASDILDLMQDNQRVVNGLLTLAHARNVDIGILGTLAGILENQGHGDEAKELLLDIMSDTRVEMVERIGAFEKIINWMANKDDNDVRFVVCGSDENSGLIYFMISTGPSITYGSTGPNFQDVPEWIDKSGKLLFAIYSDIGLENDPRVFGNKSESVVRFGKYDEFLLTLARQKNIDEWVRSTAVRTLGELTELDDRISDELLALARDKSVAPEVRGEAARTLGELGHVNEAIDVCLTLTHYPGLNDDARLIVARVLSKFNRLGEGKEILFALAKDRNVSDRIRFEVAELLDDLDCRQESQEILDILARDEGAHPRVRLDAASKLDSMVGKGELFFTLLRDYKSNSLGIHEVPYMLEKMVELDEDILSKLLTLASNEKVALEVRSEVARTLGKLGHVSEAIELSLSISHNDKAKDEARLTAADILGELDHKEEGIEITFALARDQSVDSWTRSRAYNTLKRLLGDANNDN